MSVGSSVPSKPPCECDRAAFARHLFSVVRDEAISRGFGEPEDIRAYRAVEQLVSDLFGAGIHAAPCCWGGPGTTRPICLGCRRRINGQVYSVHRASPLCRSCFDTRYGYAEGE